MFEWLQGDPVNGMLMTITFFTFLIIGRQLRLRQIAKKQLQQDSQTQTQPFDYTNQDFGGKSPLHRLDARVKFICAIFCAFSVIILTNLAYLAIPILLCAVLVVISKASLKSYVKRLLYAFTVAIVILAIQPLTNGSHIVGMVPLLGWPIYQEGISLGVLIFFRVLAATSILNLLITVTPMETLLDALAWFRIPSVILDTTMLMWRYISLISEEKTRITKAQQSRCGYTKSVSIFRKLGNYGIVGGMLLVKSFDRAIKVGNAMVSRGYTGTSSLFSYSSRPLKKKDIAICVIVIAAMIALVLLNFNII